MEDHSKEYDDNFNESFTLRIKNMAEENSSGKTGESSSGIG